MKRPILTVTPGVQGGTPCLRGTRMTLAAMVSVGADGFVRGVQASYSHLATRDVQAAYFEMHVRAVKHLASERQTAVTRARWENGSALVNGWELSTEFTDHPDYYRWTASGTMSGADAEVTGDSFKGESSARRAVVAWARKQAHGGEGER